MNIWYSEAGLDSMHFSFNVNHDPWFLILALIDKHAFEASTLFWTDYTSEIKDHNPLPAYSLKTTWRSYRNQPHRPFWKKKVVSEMYLRNPTFLTQGNTRQVIKGVKCCSLISLFYNIILSLNNLITSLCSKSNNYYCLNFYIIL